MELRAGLSMALDSLQQNSNRTGLASDAQETATSTPPAA